MKTVAVLLQDSPYLLFSFKQMSSYEGLNTRCQDNLYNNNLSILHILKRSWLLFQVLSVNVFRQDGEGWNSSSLNVSTICGLQKK